MPRYISKGQAYTMTYRFEVGGQLVTPDTNSVKVSLFDNVGDVVGDWDQKIVPVTTPASKVDLQFSAADNTTPLVIGVRTVFIEFFYNGAYHSDTAAYLLRDDVNFPLTEAEVAAAIGLTLEDLPPGMIDIQAAIDMLNQRYSLNIRGIVSSGSALTAVAIRAVQLQAAMSVVYNVQTSMMQSEQADNSLYRRFENIDFQGMFDNLAGELAAAIALLRGTPTASPTLAARSVETDAVTGV